MPAITRSDLPEHALLGRYQGSGAYLDCYHMDLPRPAAFSDYVSSFYTSSLFKVERRLLGLFARRPASDADARALALARTVEFSAWRVEARTADQLMLKDFLGHTRSWLMLAPLDGRPDGVRLYFGSAVIPRNRPDNGSASFGMLFHVGAVFHHWYSKALMRSAYARMGEVASTR